MNEYSASKLYVALDSTDDPSGVIDALALGPFVAGAEPWAGRVRLHRLRANARLLPEGVVPCRIAHRPMLSSMLAGGDGWTLKVDRYSGGIADVTVTAVDEATGNAILRGATRDATEEDLYDDVTIGFWHLGRDRAERRARAIAADHWPVINLNYPRRVREALDRVMVLTPEQVSGRLLLLHGPPGTGKTTALRALAHAWHDWCQFDYVLDPEKLLSEPAYLMDVALGDDEQDGPQEWRLLVLEDCDELIRADAKKDTGQSLARLLNLTDGLLGQGLEVIVAITTNEPLTHLHPAIVRPGRCLAHIEVGRFSRPEAIDWLGTPASIDPEGITLAELFALQGELRTVESRPDQERVGLYL